jgi:hypothetical protein
LTNIISFQLVDTGLVVDIEDTEGPSTDYRQCYSLPVVGWALTGVYGIDGTNIEPLIRYRHHLLAESQLLEMFRTPSYDIRRPNESLPTRYFVADQDETAVWA